MAFIVYTKEKKSGGVILQNTNQQYRLAGWNIIYSLWEKNLKPINQGWHLSSDNILNQINEEYNDDNAVFLHEKTMNYFKKFL